VSLSATDRRLVRLFAACVLGEWDEVRALREQAVPPEPDRRWREALLQVHLFAGVPRQVEALGVLGECGGLGEPDADEARAEKDVRARGRALFERIYAEDAQAVRAMLAAQHPRFADWVEEHAYGKVLSRGGLAADRRELLAVAALASLGQERQLMSHARGALRCGASREELLATLDTLDGLADPARIDIARRVCMRINTL